MPPHFRMVWRGSYTNCLSNQNKSKFRTAMQYLIGHCELNSHLNRCKPRNYQGKTKSNTFWGEEKQGH